VALLVPFCVPIPRIAERHHTPTEVGMSKFERRKRKKGGIGGLRIRVLRVLVAYSIESYDGKKRIINVD